MDNKFHGVLPGSFEELKVQISLGLSPIPKMTIFKGTLPFLSPGKRTCSICGDVIPRKTLCHSVKYGFNGKVISAHEECIFVPIHRFLRKEE